MPHLMRSQWLIPLRGIQHGTKISSVPHPPYTRRTYFDLNNRSWSVSRVQYTKYRISKPWTTDTQFEDIFVAAPDRDDFAKETKESPVFLRFLKIVTEIEKRPQDFTAFAKRCETGLVVEKDVYITKDELRNCMWKNGYSDQELSAFELAFPSHYRFHYPEIAVLYQLDEEDCYKFCIKQRAATPEELVELKYQPPKNLLTSYGLAFMGVWFGLSNTVLSNAWFFSKTFPFFAVLYMGASYFYRTIREYFYKEERALVAIAKEKKDAGEELLYQQIKQYSNDTKCLEALADFKSSIQEQLIKYRVAFLKEQREEMTENIRLKLVSIQQAEKFMQDSLQEITIKSIASAFMDNFNTQPALRDTCLKASIAAISGDCSNGSDDPIGAFFIKSLKELQTSDLTQVKENASGTVVERIAAVFKQKEKKFLNEFSVRPEENDEVSSIAKACKTETGFDISMLSDKQKQRLEDLYETINNRFGFKLYDESKLTLDGVLVDPAAAAYMDEISEQLSNMRQKMYNSRMVSFLESFA